MRCTVCYGAVYPLTQATSPANWAITTETFTNRLKDHKSTFIQYAGSDSASR